MTELRKFWEERHPGVETDVAHYAAVYSGRRAAMVFDVVASRQRNYLNKVRRLVADFDRRPPQQAWLHSQATAQALDSA
jgi:hypothetical protein